VRRRYVPFHKEETLPRTSSRDYSEKEVEKNGDGPSMDVVLGRLSGDAHARSVWRFIVYGVK